MVEIWLYIAAGSPSTADKFIDYVYEQCEHLCTSSEIGRTRDELLPGIRSLPVKRYLVFYRVTKDAIEIMRLEEKTALDELKKTLGERYPSNTKAKRLLKT